MKKMNTTNDSAEEKSLELVKRWYFISSIVKKKFMKFNVFFFHPLGNCGSRRALRPVYDAA